MFKQIFRITFVTLVWKQYKQIITSTILLFAFLWLVGSMHADYLAYAETLDDEALVGRSFLFKWAALASGVIIYIFYHFFRGRTKAGSNSTVTSKPATSKKNQALPAIDPDAPDPFAQIRTKEKLRTRAEIAIDKQSRK